MCAGFNQLTPLDLSRQSALNSGAFMFNDMQSKLDKSKTELCALCGQLDHAKHRVCECPRFAHARRVHEWIVDQWEVLPKCLTNHLIAPLNPCAKDLRKQLHSLADETATIYSRQTVDDFQHVFTDGSCFRPEQVDLATEAWAVVQAGTGKVLSRAPRKGLMQTIPRAEMTAVISACKWIASVRKRAVIWSDSKFVGEGVADILAGGQTSSQWDSIDLWTELREVLICIPVEDVIIRHIPAHFDKDACDSQLEEWIAAWNARVDLQARLANRSRAQVYADAVHWQEDVLRCIR